MSVSVPHTLRSARGHTYHFEEAVCNKQHRDSKLKLVSSQIEVFLLEVELVKQVFTRFLNGVKLDEER